MLDEPPTGRNSRFSRRGRHDGFPRHEVLAAGPAAELCRYTSRKHMNQSHKDKLLRINDELINEAKAVVASQYNIQVIGAPTFVDLQLLHKWWGKVKSFAHQL